MGTATSIQLYQKEVFRLACSPFVMHAVMALVTKHDRSLSGITYGAWTSFEIYHSGQAAALSNRKLSGRLCSDDRDAIVAMGLLLGSITLASIEGTTPEIAWPLKPSTADDLQWLKLSEGNKESWRIVDPFYPEICFRSFFDELIAGSHTPDQTTLAMENLPSQLLEVYDLNVVPNPENNPYLRAIQILAKLQSLKYNNLNCLSFLTFINDVYPGFTETLEHKDLRALLLMAIWYAKVCHYQWWIARRATMECKATCIYLERHYANEPIIQDLLQFPRIRCGLVPQEIQYSASTKSNREIPV